MQNSFTHTYIFMFYGFTVIDGLKHSRQTVMISEMYLSKIKIFCVPTTQKPLICESLNTTIKFTEILLDTHFFIIFSRLTTSTLIHTLFPIYIYIYVCVV